MAGDGRYIITSSRSEEPGCWGFRERQRRKDSPRMSVTQVDMSDEVAESPPERLPPQAMPVAETPSLGDRAKQASMWSTIGFVCTQGIRLVANIILTRYVSPEVFGLMAMAQTFLIALEMFSDVGIGPNIVQNKHGDEPDFYNTAWTMAVIRGFVLFGLSCIGAYPVAMFFEQPILLWVIPACGFSSVIAGFHSTSLAILNRHLNMRPCTIVDIAAQILTFAATFLWAKHHPSVWAMVVGTTCGYVFRCVVSHVILPGHTNWFRWHRDHARSMIRFGKWIFLSTGVLFFVAQSDKIMQGKFESAERLGIYGIAVSFIGLAPTLIKRLSSVVLFPVLSTVVRERPDDLPRVFRKVRLVLLAVAMAIILPLIIGGRLFVEFVYTQPYWDAGWMLQYLAAGAMVTAVCCSIGPAFFALGHTYVTPILMTSHLCLLVAAGLIGHAVGGEKGFVIGIAMVELLNYPLYAYFLIKRKLWQPELDLTAIGIAAIALVIGRAWF